MKSTNTSDAPPARVRTPGEVFVWLTALGLSVGLVLVVSLLGLVLVKGAQPFWPRRVVELTLAPSAGAELAKPEIVAGELTHGSLPTHPSSPAAKTSPAEIQIFTGNKDVFGLGFRYVHPSEFQDIAYPKNILRLDRLEYGPAFGYPEALQSNDEAEIRFGSPQFIPRLQQLLQEAGRRRQEIRHLEKSEIGAINRRLESLHLERQALASAQPNPKRLEALAAEEHSLIEAYEKLAARTRALRSEQIQHLLTCRLPSGESRSTPIGSILRWSFPNQLTLLDKLLLFLQRVWAFLSEEPREANTEGGIFPAIFGTFAMTLLMSLAVMPFGLVGAIYLREYAAQGPLVRAVRIAMNNLAGVPSIVFGVFGLGFFVYFVGGTMDSWFFSERLPTPTFGTGGLLWASLTLALMTVPVVIVATEEALAAIPRGLREASLACGASQWQTVQRILLPAAAPGILTGLILAMARGAGEVAPLMLVGVVKLAPELPINLEPPFIHFDQKFMHLGFHIFDLGFQSPDSEAAKPMVFATTLLLMALVMLMNLGAIVIREKLRRKYATGAF